jgi:hypothetical protein
LVAWAIVRILAVLTAHWNDVNDTHIIDYSDMISRIPLVDGEMAVDFLAEELEGEWLRQYAAMTPRQRNICAQTLNGFEYVYDDYASFEKVNNIPIGSFIESRLVYVHGRSGRAIEKRRVSRQRGWVGATEKYLGADTDKGHFIAHAIGGGLEINIFAQNRAINRGWSPRGTVYRKMERFCVDNPGTYCFSRPIYSDLTSRPQAVEFGLLQSDRTLWVERFDNT